MIRRVGGRAGWPACPAGPRLPAGMRTVCTAVTRLSVWPTGATQAAGFSFPRGSHNAGLRTSQRLAVRRMHASACLLGGPAQPGARGFDRSEAPGPVVPACPGPGHQPSKPAPSPPSTHRVLTNPCNQTEERLPVDADPGRSHLPASGNPGARIIGQSARPSISQAAGRGTGAPPGASPSPRLPTPSGGHACTPERQHWMPGTAGP